MGKVIKLGWVFTVDGSHPQFAADTDDQIRKMFEELKLEEADNPYFDFDGPLYIDTVWYEPSEGNQGQDNS